MIRAGVLIDAGPLVALLHSNDANHARATAVAADCAAPFRTCESVLAEAAHLLSKVDAAASQGLLALGRTGALEIALRIEQHWRSVEKLLAKYRDVPASLADACLICCAEIHQEPRIFTFDTDFTIYRWARHRRFELLG